MSWHKSGLKVHFFLENYWGKMSTGSPHLIRARTMGKFSSPGGFLSGHTKLRATQISNSTGTIAHSITHFLLVFLIVTISSLFSQILKLSFLDALKTVIFSASLKENFPAPALWRVCKFLFFTPLHTGYFKITCPLESISFDKVIGRLLKVMLAQNVRAVLLSVWKRKTQRCKSMWHNTFPDCFCGFLLIE